MDSSPPGSSVHGRSPGKSTRMSCLDLLQGIRVPNLGIEPSSHALQVDSLPSEPPGKLKNTGGGSVGKDSLEKGSKCKFNLFVG